MSKEIGTIQISNTTKDLIKSIKLCPDESYESVIKRIINTSISKENMEFIDSVVDITDSKTRDEAIEVLKGTWFMACYENEPEEIEVKKF